MAGGKRGNVVLIEAFIVLCLLFILQYVLSGISESTTDAYPGTYVISVEQAATLGDVTNHLAYVQIRDFLIDMGASHGRGNCPAEYDPRSYSPPTGPFLENVPNVPFDMTIGSSHWQKPPWIADIDSFSLVRQEFSTENIEVERVPSSVGYGLVLTGDLNDLKSRSLYLSFDYCRCYLVAGKSIDLDHPHPLILTVTTTTPEGGATSRQFVGYFHNEQLPGIDGLVSPRLQNKEFDNPPRRFALRLFADATVTTANFVAQ